MSKFKEIFKTDNAISTTPTLVDNVLYFGNDDGYFYAIKADTLEEIWSIGSIGVRYQI